MKRAKTFGWSVTCGIAVLMMIAATPSPAYNMGSKACRGIAAMTCFFLELPGNMVDVSNKNGVGAGLTEGFGKGLIMMPMRGLTGIYELFTFPFEIQKGYEPVVEPDYPWGYFCGEDKPAKAGETKK